MKKRTTISAHVDQATIERIDQLAKLENRSRSQMTGTVIKLGAELSPEAWSVLLQLNSQGSEEDWQAIRQEITRLLLHHRYRLTQRKMAGHLDSQWLDSLKTEDDILLAAVELTRNV
ncbi:MAG: ribbon-helix-helix protein, CopG family [Snowella sp.]|jgi:hypothetical protein|nr:ribbon-helix-helix protein, CopG family [Snowella sp.]PZV20763.1 MAG: hypothetical protein DCF12_22150 [Snowella sp.]